MRLELLFLALLINPFIAHGQVKFKVLHTFDSGQDGSTPSGPLLLNSAGGVYGNTYDGGTGKCSDYGCGMIFELQPQAGGRWKELIVHEFTGGNDGATPMGNLVSNAAGTLHGTMHGALVGQGGVVELKHSSKGWNLGIIFDHGVPPGLLLDDKGDLFGYFGAGKYQAGAIGELSPGLHGWTYKQLYSFCDTSQCLDGEGPQAPLSWDAHGNLYGTTEFGGNGPPNCPGGLGCGVAFQLTPKHGGGWTYHVIHRFANSRSDGQSPLGGLVIDALGDLYGTTSGGGPTGAGSVFKFALINGRWKQIVLYGFPVCADGCIPGSTLVFDKAGSLYGAASGGNQGCGPDPCGVIFKLTPQKNGKWSYSVMHKFSGPDGNFPWGVVLDSKGNVFGTTQAGGAYNAGVAFELSP